ncbi:phosphoglycerol transferase [Pseudomonas capeferrum]|uniref:ArnT family glycosyltransferase n=1 Tax=Pseudomonas capeferrum TaxID=1495066 RepID=UPI0015E307E0|nr:glycosyltransferase family 39 protein [Pseudomonas capeferrum]MBA1204474.1 phosphoglycerol transferase [Pseudomonas capeferrum]
MQLVNGSRLTPSAAVLGMMVLALVLLVLRSSGIYPSVMGDEYTYSSMARVLPLSAASIPNYLYLSIYKGTLLCGSGFMGCTKLFNALFFVAAAPFIYLTARRFCDVRVSLVIVAVSLLGPINIYTAYFMPEALFFFTFWVSVWYFLSLDARATARQWVIFGLIVGCSSLVKPHALFVIPAFCLCIMFFAYKALDRWFVTGLKNAAIFVVTLLLTKFIFSYLVAGKAGLTLFGNFYATTLESNASSLQRYLDILLAAPSIVGGHLLANALMFGLAFAIVILVTIKALSNRVVLPEHKIAFCTLALLLNLIAVVALFSASVAGSNAAETAFRLHMRYYDFMLPLLFIAVGSQINLTQEATYKYWKYAIGAVMLLAIIYATANRMHPFTLSFIDNPELRGYTLSKKAFVVLACLSLLSIVLWWKSVATGAKFFIFAYLPLSVAVSTVGANIGIIERTTPDAYDKAGQFAKSYLSPAELSKLLVVGESAPQILRALYWVEDLNAGPDLTYKPGVPYTAAQTPADKKWILAIGDVDFVRGDFHVMKFRGYSLAKKIGHLYPLVVDFRGVALPDSVTNITGLADAESWGTWSAGDKVTMEFAQPLPSAFELEIYAKAFGPNEGQAFDVVVDGKSYPVTIGKEIEPHKLQISNVGHNVESLIIKVPSPTSPKQLGVSADARLLGIGLHQLIIHPPK